jgi:4-amino-4-deoxy-L-arabinose transferase-like glycosyltransferase
MAQWTQQAAIVGLVAGIVLFTNLGGPDLWDRDEPRNAGCALEMQQRGDWVTPVFNGELRTHKPVLLYWLMMVAYSAFGVGEFAARFWSAALGVGIALCTYAIGRRLFDGRVGLWSGIAVSTSLLFCVASRAATPDALVMFLSTLSIAIYVYGTFCTADAERSSQSTRPQQRTTGNWFPENWFVVASLYAVMGLGVLAKGPVGVVLPCAVIGMFLLIVRLPAQDAAKSTQLPTIVRAFTPKHFLQTLWSMRPFTAVIVTLAVAAPWYIWVGMRTDGEFLRGFFFEHNIGRAMRPMEGHDGGPLFYPIAILVGFFPWSVFALPLVVDAVSRVRRGDPWQLGYLLAGCWVGVYLVLFSLAKTKLPSYVTPCYPGLALLTGGFVVRWLQGTVIGSKHLRRLAFAALALVGLAMIISLPIIAHQHLPGDEWLGIVGLIPLLAGLIAWRLFERDQPQTMMKVLAVSAVLLVTVSFGLIADRVSQRQQNHQLLAEVDRRGDKAKLASFGLLEPTWVFYGGRSIAELPWSGDAEWLGGWVEVAGKWLPKPALSVDDLSDAASDWVIITTEQHVARLRTFLPEDFQVISRAPYFLKGEDLVLVGRAETWRIAVSQGRK